MMVVEHMACRVPEDPTFPMPAEGYVVSFLAFYELGYTTPSHWFLCSLLLYYGIELHNLTPSMVLHLAAFMNLCEAYLRIDPEFGLLNYFFGVQRPQELDVELIVSGGATIHVRSDHGVDPYFDLPMPRSMKRWRKKSFYLRNNASNPLSVLTGSHQIPLPPWGGGGLGRTSTTCSPGTRPFSSCGRRV
jgi:hypothetical protein